MKLFKTTVSDTVKVCQDYSAFICSDILTEKRRKTLLPRFDRFTLSYINVHSLRFS